MVTDETLEYFWVCATCGEQMHTGNVPHDALDDDAQIAFSEFSARHFEETGHKRFEPVTVPEEDFQSDDPELS